MATLGSVQPSWAHHCHPVLTKATLDSPLQVLAHHGVTMTANHLVFTAWANHGHEGLTTPILASLRPLWLTTTTFGSQGRVSTRRGHDGLTTPILASLRPLIHYGNPWLNMAPHGFTMCSPWGWADNSHPGFTKTTLTHYGNPWLTTPPCPPGQFYHVLTTATMASFRFI